MTVQTQFVEFVKPPVAKVQLLSVQQNAVKVVALLTRGYSQRYDTEISPAEVEDMLEQIKRTKLKTPLEFVQTIWLIRDVSRAFTHQLVRYRIGTQFVQESLRFSERRTAKVLLTPEIERAGEAAIERYRFGIEGAIAAYDALLDKGVPVQDARGLLPHHVLTDLFFGCSLQTLAHIFNTRTCCQAQHVEWLPVVYAMKEQLPEELQAFLIEPWKEGKGSCGFGSSFDRACKFEEAFRHNRKRLMKEWSGDK